jgi:hypothetical protein
MRGDTKAECDVKSAEAQRAHLKALQEATTEAAALRQAIDADLFALAACHAAFLQPSGNVTHAKR